MAVGKSCILLRYSDDVFNSTHISTIGVDFKIRTIQFKEKTIKLQIWDTAGQERFRTITTSYYKGAHGIILVYDITKRESFENLQSWCNDIKSYADEDVGTILIGNKLDLESQRQVSTQEGEEWASKLGIPFLETSAKASQNVESAFTKMVERIFEKKITVGGEDKSKQNDGRQHVITNKPPAVRKHFCSIL